MTHEGLMKRGEEKYLKGIVDYETQYFLDNKPPVPSVKEEPVKEVKEKKDAKPKSR